MARLRDIAIGDIKAVANFLGIKEVKEQNNNPSTLNSKIIPTYTPSLKPKITETERRDVDRHGDYISVFDRDHPYPNQRTPEELRYLESKDKPKRRNDG